MAKEIDKKLVEGNKVAEELYQEWLAISDKIENHPDRYLYYPHKDDSGETVKIDLTSSWHWVGKKFELTEIDEEEKKEVKIVFSQLATLKGVKSKIYRDIMREIGLQSKRITPLDLEKEEVLDLYSKFYTHNDVHKFLTEKKGYNVQLQTVKKWYSEHKDEIQVLRDETIKETKELQIAREEGRLMGYAQLYSYYQEQFRENHRKEDARMMMGILKSAREEVKGTEIKFTVEGKIDIQATMQAKQALSTTLSQVSINSLVIGLVAERRKIDPSRIIAALSTSKWAKFNGFNGETLTAKEVDEQKVDIIYPSQIIKQYNWDVIKEKNSKIQQESDQPISRILDYDKEAERERVNERRKQLKKLLRERAAI